MIRTDFFMITLAYFTRTGPIFQLSAINFLGMAKFLESGWIFSGTDQVFTSGHWPDIFWFLQCVSTFFGI